MSGGAVDTKTVEMRFDNSNFEKNTKQSISTLERLKQALKLDGASAGLREVESASKKLDFRDFKGNIDSVGKRFGVLETIATGALLRIGASAADAGVKLAKSLTVDQLAAGWSKYEQKTTAVQTIMANLRDDQSQFVDEADKLDYVEKQLDKLLWFSDETSYSFTDMTSNVGKFIANGQGLEDSVTAMQGIAAWAAVAGQNSTTAARAMYNISQAMGVGAMTNIDWKSIEGYNMATAQFKELAITIGQKQGKIKEGEVTLENFRDSLTMGAGKNAKKWFDKDVMMEVFKTYGEAADRIQKYAEAHNVNTTEAIRKIKEEDATFAESLGFKAFEAAQAAKTFGEVVSGTADAVSTKWMRIFQNIFGNYLEAKELWSNLAEEMWEIFAAPLDTLNEIMVMWKRGFFAEGPAGYLDKWFEEGKLDTLENNLHFISEEVAKTAVANDAATYSIRKLDDGTEQLVRTTKNASGEIVTHYQTIYKAGDDLLSGRTALIEGFQNLMDTFIHDVEDDDGNLESMSFFGSFKRGLQEVIFGTSEVDEIVPKVSRKIWELTKRFKELTERLKPSMETSLKLKNAFKGLFTLFKIGGKFVKAVIKPFKDLFKEIFAKKEGSKGLLDLADSMGTWIQKLDEFLDRNKVFDRVSEGIKTGLDWIRSGVDALVQSMTGMSSTDFFADIKTKVFGFFENYDFETTLSNIGGFFRGIIDDIKQVNTGELEGELTPLQNFWLGVKGIFEGMKRFFTLISPAFRWIGQFINNVFTSISEAFSNRKNVKNVEKANPIWEGIKNAFSGIADFFEKVSPTLEKIGIWIGDFFSNLGDAISTWAKDKTPEEIIEGIVKGGFIISLTNLINSIAGLNRGRKSLLSTIADDLGEIGGVLKAYQREINASTLIDVALAIGILSGSLWVISQIDSDKIKTAGKALGQLAVVIAGFSILKDIFKIITNVSSTMEGTNTNSFFGKIKSIFTGMVGTSVFANDASAKFLKASAAIALLAVGFKIFSNSLKIFIDGVSALGEKSSDEHFKNGLKSLAYVTAGLAVLSLFNGLGSRRAVSALISVLSFIVLIKTISSLVDSIAKMGANTNFTYFKSGLYMFGMLAAVVTLFTAINSIGSGKLRASLGLYISMMAVLLVINSITESLSKLAKDTEENRLAQAGDIIKNIIEILVVWLLIFGLIEKFGKNRGSMLMAGAAILAAAASVYLIAMALAKIAKVDSTKIEAAGNCMSKIVLAVGAVLAVVGLVSSFNFKIGKAGGLLTGSFKGILGVPIGALSFVAACAGVWIIAQALNSLSEIKMDWESVGKLAAVTGLIALIVDILGVAAGLDIGAYGTIGAAGLAGGYFGTLGVPLAALSFAAACQGVYVIVKSLAILDDVHVDWGNIKKLSAMAGIVALIVDILGLAAGLNVGAYGTVGLAGIAGGYSGTLGVPLAALSFAAACQGVYIMAKSLVVLSDIRAYKLEKAVKNIQKVIETVAIVVGILGIIAGFTDMGMLIGAVSFDIIVSGISGLVDILDRFSHLDLSNLKRNLDEVADSLKEFFVRAGDAIDKAIELGAKVVPVAAALGLAFIVLAAGVAAIGGALIVLGIGLEYIGSGASAAGEGIINAADAFVELSNKDLSGIGLNLLTMAGALIGISVAGLLASPGLIALGFALEAVLGPVTRATDAIVDLMGAIERLRNGGSGSGGLAPKVTLGSFVSGPFGWLIRGAEYIYDACTGAKEEAEGLVPAVAEGAAEGASEAVPKLESTGKIVDGSLAKGVTESDMTASAAYEKWAEMYGALTSSGNMGQAELGGYNLLSMFGSGALNFDMSSIGNISLGTFLQSLQDGGKDAGPIGMAVASIFGEGFKDFDFESMSQKGLDEIIATMSNGQIDIKSAGDLLTNTFGDEWKNYDWTTLTLNDVMKVLSQSMTENIPEVESAAEGVSDAGASAMGQEQKYGAAGGKNVLGYAAAIADGRRLVLPASAELGSSVEGTLSGLNSYGWGSDMVSQYALGISSGESLVRAAVSSIAGIVYSFMHFSEPDEGPLSDFHTYAPDMVKLWCKGVYDNLGSVESSTTDFADTVYDGFSTALDYVSDLIDNGMSDQLTIRPVMDLSEIQNGVDSMYGMMSSANGYEITGTTRLAASSAYGMRGVNDAPQTTTQTIQSDSGPISNTFYITNGDPNAVAEKVSKILSQQTRRQKAVWAK